uniref:HEAT repeat-containing protein 1 n=1 Tax=Eptatretus burgeri TaxID=7764 RepID=A0A8C4R077_EPTBU
MDIWQCASAPNAAISFISGCTGLEQLASIDPSFADFGKSLFSTAAIGLERSVQGRETNKQLDGRIKLFLTRLSPFFLLKPAQKCLEWLVNRFHIHRYNEDALLACAMPFHESQQFVRVVQLLRIKDPTHRWHWLFPLQKHKVPLARSTLVTHCYKDPVFADFLCCLAFQAVKVCCWDIFFFFTNPYCHYIMALVNRKTCFIYLLCYFTLFFQSSSHATDFRLDLGWDSDCATQGHLYFCSFTTPVWLCLCASGHCHAER